MSGRLDSCVFARSAIVLPSRSTTNLVSSTSLTNPLSFTQARSGMPPSSLPIILTTLRGSSSVSIVYHHCFLQE